MDEVMHMLRQIQTNIETERREHKQALENACKMVTRASLAANEAEAECARLRAALDWLVIDVIQLHWPCEAAGCDVCRNLGTASNLLAKGESDDAEQV